MGWSWETLELFQSFFIYFMPPGMNSDIRTPKTYALTLPLFFAPAAPGLPGWSPIRTRTRPDAARPPRSDGTRACSGRRGRRRAQLWAHVHGAVLGAAGTAGPRNVGRGAKEEDAPGGARGRTSRAPGGRCSRPRSLPDSVSGTSLLARGPGAGGSVRRSEVGTVPAPGAGLDAELRPVGERFVTSG